MKLIEKLNKLDNSEKDFLILALAFILVTIFLFLMGFFKSDITSSSNKIYFGYNEIDIENIELNEIQKMFCTNANEYNNCNKLDETLIITKEICCTKMEICCNDG
jgi:hypothetical protein